MCMTLVMWIANTNLIQKSTHSSILLFLLLVGVSVSQGLSSICTTSYGPIIWNPTRTVFWVRRPDTTWQTPVRGSVWIEGLFKHGEACFEALLTQPSFLLLFVASHSWSHWWAAGVQGPHNYHQTLPQVPSISPSNKTSKREAREITGIIHNTNS